MSERDVRPLLSDSFRTENVLSQKVEITRATDAVQQYSVAVERLWPTKLQGDGLDGGLREPYPKFRLGYLVELIFSAQSYVSWNKKALYWIEIASKHLKVDCHAVRNEHDEGSGCITPTIGARTIATSLPEV
jgi:hypothetical protein